MIEPYSKLASNFSSLGTGNNEVVDPYLIVVANFCGKESISAQLGHKRSPSPKFLTHNCSQPEGTYLSHLAFMASAMRCASAFGA